MLTKTVEPTLVSSVSKLTNEVLVENTKALVFHLGVHLEELRKREVQIYFYESSIYGFGGPRREFYVPGHKRLHFERVCAIKY